MQFRTIIKAKVEQVVKQTNMEGHSTAKKHKAGSGEEIT